MTAPRKDLAALLKPLLPRTWKIVEHQTTTDVLTVTKVTLKQLRIVRTPAAPQGAHDIEFIVTITSALTDPARAEDELDDQVNMLIHALDRAGIPWSSAAKVLDGDSLAYDITLTLTSTPDPIKE
ncbi:hypothetical protein [Glaciibacter psychrotolerans]|uniref:DUF3168 domain-containing protein n=1 Tax=Glaciibacter psychrotolerans TaxID=670054 RepID=A0A7Z0J7C3_9MICO|nr:hypothetical protein [Leifsonia psychrotolerans]NYJ20809.1 hypothetical protein [Leifsonia psychrotolerans]